MSDLPIPKALDDALGFNLYRVAMLFRRELMVALTDHSLMPEQWQVLVALSEYPNGLSQSEVARLTLKDKHSVSRILDRMEDAGWVKRRADRSDLRAFRVVLSARAKHAVPPMAVQLRMHFRDVVGTISSGEQKQLLKLLKRLRQRLDARQMSVEATDQ